MQLEQHEVRLHPAKKCRAVHVAQWTCTKHARESQSQSGADHGQAEDDAQVQVAANCVALRVPTASSANCLLADLTFCRLALRPTMTHARDCRLTLHSAGLICAPLRHVHMTHMAGWQVFVCFDNAPWNVMEVMTIATMIR